jgi:hypothetical protein
VHSKLYLCNLMIVLFTLLPGMVCAQNSPQPAKPLEEKSGAPGLHHAYGDTRSDYSADQILTSLQDTRLSLGQIKQQSINIFLEGSRTMVTLKDSQIFEIPQSLTENMIKHSGSKFLAPRKDWLVFYTNTLEPIMHLLNEDVKDIEKHGLGVPEPLSTKLQPVYRNWRQDIADINKAMDNLQELIRPDSGTNEAIARSALAIYTHATHMEKLRDQAALLCREHKWETNSAKK